MSIHSSAIMKIREVSRQLVREFGFLKGHLEETDLNHSQCHALIEIDKHSTLSVIELSKILKLDKSTISRLIKSLIKKDLIKICECKDARLKPLMLTDAGFDYLVKINHISNNQVNQALYFLDEDEQKKVYEGIELYAKALAKSNEINCHKIRPIQQNDNVDMARIIVQVMTEFGAVGEGFSITDEEVKHLYESYNKAKYCYYVIENNSRIYGGGGIGPLPNEDDSVCELKKMYFVNDIRGKGLGRKLLETLLEEAMKMGYKTVYLETLEHMNRARELYKKLGFEFLEAPMGKTGHYKCNSWMKKTFN
jgi:putative acetyltransferase